LLPNVHSIKQLDEGYEDEVWRPSLRPPGYGGQAKNGIKCSTTRSIHVVQTEAARFWWTRSTLNDSPLNRDKKSGGVWQVYREPSGGSVRHRP
jgi:hypothetical protein